MSEPKPITFDEVMSKLDELRTSARDKKQFTPEMDTLILRARTGEKVVPYAKIQQLWTDLGWGHVATSTLNDRFRQLSEK